MSSESMNKLADEYILSNGMVNYLYCFRNYLGDVTGRRDAAGAAAYGSGNKKLSKLQEIKSNKSTGL